MKRTKIIYWLTTGLFAGFMAFTAIPDIILVPGAVEYITHLGYPMYFIVFIGVAKLLGSIGILVPSFKKIKEWAYAGLFFDLIAAGYSNIIIDGVNGGIVFISAITLLGVFSYVYNEKYQAARNAA